MVSTHVYAAAQPIGFRCSSALRGNLSLYEPVVLSEASQQPILLPCASRLSHYAKSCWVEPCESDQETTKLGICQSRLQNIPLRGTYR